MIKALHVETMRREDLHAEREPHILFQASTIGALLDGAYDGDVSFAELAQHGDLGLGTLNGLDGEMIALDGRFHRADVEGEIHPVECSAQTPFAVVVPFEPAIVFELGVAMTEAELLAEVDRRVPADTVAFALRADGAFDVVWARSVPRQEPPYRPLAEVIGKQLPPGVELGSPDLSAATHDALAKVESSG